jgi:hypothetical protein
VLIHCIIVVRFSFLVLIPSYDVQDTSILLLGGTEERKLIIIPEDRSAIAIAVWAAVELSRIGIGKSPSSLQEYVCGIGGRTISEGGIPQNKKKVWLFFSIEKESAICASHFLLGFVG